MDFEAGQESTLCICESVTHMADDLLIIGSNYCNNWQSGFITCSFSILSHEDEDQFSVGWNVTDREYGLLACFVSLFIYLRAQIN